MNHHHKIQELPQEERPYEKCLKKGPEILSDSELLAVIIRSGVPGTSSIELAETILQGMNGKEGLLGIHHLSSLSSISQ